MSPSALRVVVLVLLLLPACGKSSEPSRKPRKIAGDTAPVAPFTDRRPDPTAPVTIGRFTLSTGGLNTRTAPQFRCMAQAADEPGIRVWIGPDFEVFNRGRPIPGKKAHGPLLRSTTALVPGAGEVRCIVRARLGSPIDQEPNRGPYQADLSRAWFWERESCCVVLETGDPTVYASSSDEPDAAAWHSRILDQAVEQGHTDPSVELIRLMAGKRIVLASRWFPDGEHTVRARIDGSDSIALAPGPRRQRSPSFLLPARPGQTVVLEIAQPYRKWVATTEGIGCDPSPRGSPGHLMIGGVQHDIPRTGRVAVSLGRLDSPRAIRFYRPRPGRRGHRSSGFILLRWGRPEEAWLDTGLFPLAGPIDPATVSNGIAAVSADLAAAWDPDFETPLQRRGTRNSWEPKRFRGDNLRFDPVRALVEESPKGGGSVSARTVAQAAARLHLGYLLTGNVEASVRCDALTAELEKRARATGAVGTGELQPEDRLGDRPGAIELLSLRGQLAALRGDEAVLEETRRPILSLLARQSDRARAAYRLYENATRDQRLELLAVLQGRSLRLTER